MTLAAYSELQAVLEARETRWRPYKDLTQEQITQRGEEMSCLTGSELGRSLYIKAGRYTHAHRGDGYAACWGR